MGGVGGECGERRGAAGGEDEVGWGDCGYGGGAVVGGWGWRGRRWQAGRRGRWGGRSGGVGLGGCSGVFCFKQETAYEINVGLEFRRVLIRSVKNGKGSGVQNGTGLRQGVTDGEH